VPSAAVVVVRAKPLTTLVISIDAFTTALPDGSFTEPSIDPEFPDCAQLELAQAKKPKTKNKSLSFLIIIRISPLPLNWAMFVFCWSGRLEMWRVGYATDGISAL